MPQDEWFELGDGCVVRTEGKTNVYSVDGDLMFSLPWRASLQIVKETKAIADRAYRIGCAVGANAKVHEIRRALELPGVCPGCEG